MPQTAPTTHQLQAVINAAAAHKTKREAALALGMKATTFNLWHNSGVEAGLKPRKSVESPEAAIARLERDLKIAQKQSADAAMVKSIIGNLVALSDNVKPPTWLVEPGKHSAPGVPTLFLSDLHWGENVRPSQINHVNSYNLSIAQERLRTAVKTAIHLLHIVDRDDAGYPGIVVPLGGDMISGDIHEELEISNELPTIPTVLDLYENLSAAITVLADTFGAVFLPCVTGNHGRNTHKIRAKDRHHTSFDWMLYALLARRFALDKRITFHIPDGSDAAWRIYNTRYCLTHGDQFRGGDGMIGALGPIIRGDHKKRSRNGQIDMDYDILLLGHWHQYTHLTRLIVNGSLKGMDEYAYTNNFGFELAQQALWVTHPKYGPTFRMPVYVQERKMIAKTAWVSVPSNK